MACWNISPVLGIEAMKNGGGGELAPLEVSSFSEVFTTKPPGVSEEQTK